MSVQPPRGLGRMRVLEIEGVDLQPCGGTHVANTAEVGAVVVTKIEKKSAMTRRVVLGFAARANPWGARRAQRTKEECRPCSSDRRGSGSAGPPEGAPLEGGSGRQAARDLGGWVNQRP
jgi:hypothetical protein